MDNIAVIKESAKYWKIIQVRLLNEKKISFVYNWSTPSQSELTPYKVQLGLTHLGLETSNIIWRPPSQSELTPYKVQLWLTHLGLETSYMYV